jgi:hypothetical protein
MTCTALIDDPPGWGLLKASFIAVLIIGTT